MTAMGIEFESLPIFGMKGVAWSASAVLENSGNSPTKDMIVTTVCTPSFEPMNDPARIEKTNLLYKSRTVDFRRMVFGPKQIARAGFCPVSALNEILSLFPGGIHLYVHGAVMYHDIFDDQHVHLTDFCFDNVNFNAGGTTNDPTMTAFSFACRNRNCVDEECSAEQQKAAADFMDRKIKVYRVPSFRRLLERMQQNQAKPPAQP